MRILHLSADYPDPLQPSKTRAVSNLLAGTGEHEHRVWSLNRVDWRAGIAALDFADAVGSAHRAVAYGAPPKGLFLRRFLLRLAAWIAEDAARAGFAPDLVHAHKLSVEGLAGEVLARRLGVPLIVSLQGDSDLKIVGAKPSLREVYRRIWREAATVFPFAPWTAARMEAILGPREGPIVLLPCPTGADALRAPRVVGPLFRTAFHLGSARRKNAACLIAAAARARKTVPELRLEIAGGGDPAAFARLARATRRAPAGAVGFVGALAHDRVQDFFNGACAFALVSRRETYGMVFAEALLAGAPCLLPRGWAIDGYLEDGGAVLAADSDDEAEIADGLVRLAREEAAFKARLAALAESGGLDLLRRDAIFGAYRAALVTAAADAG